MNRRIKTELLAWIEQHQPVTRGNLLDAFEDMDYEQLEGWLSELQRKRRLFEVNPETYYTTIEPRDRPAQGTGSRCNNTGAHQP